MCSNFCLQVMDYGVVNHNRTLPSYHKELSTPMHAAGPAIKQTVYNEAWLRAKFKSIILSYSLYIYLLRVFKESFIYSLRTQKLIIIYYCVFAKAILVVVTFISATMMMMMRSKFYDTHTWSLVRAHLEIRKRGGNRRCV